MVTIFSGPSVLTITRICCLLSHDRTPSVTSCEPDWYQTSIDFFLPIWFLNSAFLYVHRYMCSCIKCTDHNKQNASVKNDYLSNSYFPTPDIKITPRNEEQTVCIFKEQPVLLVDSLLTFENIVVSSLQLPLTLNNWTIKEIRGWRANICI